MVRSISTFLLMASFTMLPALAFDEIPVSETVDVADVEVTGVVISTIEQIDIPTLESGLIMQVNADEGQHVQQGDVLANINSEDAELANKRAFVEWEAARALAENTTEIDLAQKSLQLAQADFRRLQKSRQLYARAVSDEELEHSQLVIDQATLKVRQAQEAQKQRQRDSDLAELTLQMMKLRLDRHRIAAPWGGMIVEIKRRSGEWIEAGQPVARMVRVDRLRAKGSVGAMHLAHLKRGQPVSISVPVFGTESKPAVFDGVLKFVSPEINSLDGQVQIWAEVDNKHLHLHPGTRATMTVDVSAPVTKDE